MNRQQQGYFWLGLAVVAAVIVGSVGYLSASGDTPPVIGALIWTGHLAFLVFQAPLFASPLRDLFPSPLTTRLLRYRRNAGVTYGGVQAVHLVVIGVMFSSLADPPVEVAMVIVEGIGIVLAMAMLWTSFEKPMRAIGTVNWRRIHRTGFHVFMFIYLYDFVVEPLLFDIPILYPVHVTLLFFGMTLRTVSWVKSSPVTAS